MAQNPKYGLSSYGKLMVIDEGLEGNVLPPIRIVFILLNVVMVAIMLGKSTLQYTQNRASIHRKKGSSGLLTSLFIAFTVNNILRGSHMIDHITRPIYYHEPLWAYQKIWLTETEVPTYAHLLAFFSGIIGLGKLMNWIESGNANLRRPGFLAMFIYVANSLFNLVHYTIEPPSNYGPMPNLNIAGTGITNIPILILLAYMSLNRDKIEKLGAKERTADREGRKQLLPEDSGRVTRSKTRRRSKTPVKK